MVRRLMTAIALTAATGFAANAQRAQDTVRVAVYQPVPIVDTIYNPSPETSLVANPVFDSLVHFDADKREYRPLLAKSWERLDPKTVEFKLREGVKFHDGSTFDADDVVYSLEAYMDPKNNFRFKDNRFGWIEKIEKTGPYSVRITSKDSFAPFLSRLTSNIPIYPENIYRPLENKGDFGRKPVGTGPFKVVSFDPAKGEVVYERYDDYAMKDVREPAHVKRIMLSSIPDQQTQVAKILSGGLDVVYGIEPDAIPSLRANPNLAIDVERTVQFTYIQFDTKNRSGVDVFKDKRVREALLMAIDRPGLIKAFVPPEHQGDKPQQSMCYEWHIGCASTLDPVKYDPIAAKKLLTEAGYPNGFDLALTTWGPSRRITEAVAGQLRKIGVNAKVDSSTLGIFVQKRADGKIQTQVSIWDNGVAQPDVESTMGFFFQPSSRDQIGDPILAKAVEDGQAELDPKKREDIYRTAFDRVTAERYAMPLVPMAAIVVHDKGLKLLGNHKSPEGIELNHLSWK
jgi:peptide/nickel transport system substrate-binding protein